MDTVAYRVSVGPPWEEIVVAELSELGFTAFSAEAGVVSAFIPAERWSSPDFQHALALWKQLGRCEGAPTVEPVESQDYVGMSRQTFQPLYIGPFLIRPTWSTAPPGDAGQIVLSIDPRMSFGTGHHATTRLALGLMSQLVQRGARVLDVGTGTGILAMAAAKLGASHVWAIDTDPQAVKEAGENAHDNGVAGQITPLVGSLEAIQARDFDLVIANMEASRLGAVLSDLVAHAREGARILLSGIRTSERQFMLAMARQSSLVLVEEASEDSWWAVALTPERPQVGRTPAQ